MGRKTAAAKAEDPQSVLDVGDTSAPIATAAAACNGAALMAMPGVLPTGSGGLAGGAMVMMPNPMMVMPSPMMLNTNPMMMAPNPVMVANPMMAMMMGGVPAGVAAAALPPTMVAPAPVLGISSQGGATASQPSSLDKYLGPVDPQVRALCRAHNIEDRLMRKLNDVMMRRPDTFEEDLQSLREKLSLSERPDVGILITQMDRGIFVAKGTMHKDMVTLVEKYKLDDRATRRLIETMEIREDTLKEDLRKIDIRLASADRPSGLLMTLLQGLDTNGKLPPPPRSLGLVGFEEEERERERQRERERDRERQRLRDKVRDRDRDRRSRSRSKSKSRSRSRSRSRRGRR